MQHLEKDRKIRYVGIAIDDWCYETEPKSALMSMVDNADMKVYGYSRRQERLTDFLMTRMW